MARMSNDTLRPILKSHYHASLAMPRDAIAQCPADLCTRAYNFATPALPLAPGLPVTADFMYATASRTMFW